MKTGNPSFGFDTGYDFSCFRSLAGKKYYFGFAYVHLFEANVFSCPIPFSISTIKSSLNFTEFSGLPK